MSQTAHRISNVHSVSIAGKVFLLGEYAVLAGQPAIVAAVGPRFVARWGDAEAAWTPRAESPAGRLLAECGLEGAPLALSDPHEGRGGLGASTAEFVLVYKWLAAERAWPIDWASILRKYVALHAEETVPPSGADLAIQVAGGIAVFDPVVPALESLGHGSMSASLVVFSAAGLPGRKVATHEHRQALSSSDALDPRSEWISLVSEQVAAGKDAWVRGQVSEFGRALTNTAEVLSSQGFESPGARADRFALQGLPGVHGVKGSGAMLSDVIVGCVDPAQQGAWIAAAEARGLRLVTQGIPREEGMNEVNSR